MCHSRNFKLRQARIPHVLIFAGGGLGPVSGGVGTLLRAWLLAWREQPESLPVRVIDTRGQGGALGAAWSFAHAVALLLWMRARGEVACAHVHMTTRGSALRKALLCALARRLGVNVILHLHGADFFEFCARLPLWGRHGLSRILRSVHLLVVVSAQWREDLARALDIPLARIRVLPNGVAAACQAAPPPGPPHILFLGRIGARKGVGELIAALADPDLARRPWHATLAGDGQAGPYQARLAACGLHGRVRMPGWQDRPHTEALLAGASILALPSHHEVMPIALLEAMARGIAIVTTPVGAIPELLVHGHSALFVPPGDAAALGRALAALLDDPGLRARLGEAARQAFQERYGIAPLALQMQAFYRAAARCPEPGARLAHLGPA